MKVVMLIVAACFLFCAVQAQRATQYILVPKDSLDQQMIGQLKEFNPEIEGKFLQDDTSTLSKVIFQQDTLKVYVILSWEGQVPTSVPNAYNTNGSTITEKIFTESQIKDYIEQNQYIPVDQLLNRQ